MTKAITAAVVIMLATPTLACAESWVLWASVAQRPKNIKSRPATIAIHDTKAACLVAAKEHVTVMRRNKLEAVKDAMKIRVEGLKQIINDAPETREARPLSSGQGYVSRLEINRSMQLDRSMEPAETLDLYYFIGECCPVGVTPQ